MALLFMIGGLIWLSALLYAAPAVWQMLTGKPVHRGDPVRLAVFITAVVIVAGCLRWLFAPESMQILAAIFVLLIADGFYILHLMRSYGRGERL